MRTFRVLTPWLLCLLALARGWAQDRPKLLILGPDSKGFNEVVQTVTSNLSEDFDVRNFKVDEFTDFETFESVIETEKPKVIALMENYAINHYRSYQAKYGPDKDYPVTILAMALFIDETIKGLQNTTGIRYEIPVVSSVRSLRSAVKVPIQKVGVIYREQIEPYIDKQKSLCAEEEIELVGYQLAAQEKNLPKALRAGLKYLISKEKIDALWILSDNTLITEETLAGAWFPRLSRYKKPIIVGVENLLLDDFGNFAVIPDHHSIGLQISNLAEELLINDFELYENGSLENPLGQFKIINLSFAKRYLGVKTDGLIDIDRTK